MFLKVLFFGFIGFLFAFFIFNLFTKKYLNPYKLIMVFGKKGSGKSTLLTRFAIDHIKRGWTVYTTERTPNCYYIDHSRIGLVQFEDFNFIPFEAAKGLKGQFQKVSNWFNPKRPKILLLVDEVGMIWDNRNFKNFQNYVRDFFKLQRHYHVKVVLFSQTFDIDKKLRDLTDQMFLCTNVFRVFSVAKRIKKYATIVETSSGESTLSEGYKFESFLVPGSRIWTFIPKYSKYFDSFEAPQLEKIKFEKVKYHKQSS